MGSYRYISNTLGLQKAQSRYYLQTLDTKVGTICILGALGEPLKNSKYRVAEYLSPKKVNLVNYTRFI